MSSTAATPMTVAQALTSAQAQGIERLDAQHLLGSLLGQSRSWLFSHDDSPLEPAQAQTWADWCRRLADGEPLAYLLGQQDFHGLTLQVSPAVLVPRPDTEVLVDWALDTLNGALAHLPAPRVIDLGTGSGAIALAVKQACPRAVVHALDASPEALAVARGNGEQLGLAVHWLHSHWWQGVAGEPFDLVLSNPPYIPGDDPHLADLAHEPRMALTPEGDGLAAYREIVAGCDTWLATGGWLLLEHGYDQGDSVPALLRAAGLQNVRLQLDLAGRARCTGGQKTNIGAQL